MKLIIINGPNLNLLGKREPEVYGNESFESYFETLKKQFPDVELSYFQSNIEGEIVDKIQEVGFSYDGIIINAGGYSHTSVAIRDALAAVKTPAVEVHISAVNEREAFRQVSYVREACIACVVGKGFDGYLEAMDILHKHKEENAE